MKTFTPDFRLIVSDFHLGTGQRRGIFNPYEDYFEDGKFEEFLQFYSGEFGGGKKIELILNGDILDLMKVQVGKEGAFTEEITEEVAAHKAHQCLSGHPGVCQALTSFLDRGGTEITVVPGNHDIELLLPVAQKVFRDAIAPGSLGGRLKFIDRTPAYSLPEGIQIHHGHMFEAHLQFDYRQLMVKRYDAQPILYLPWGSVLLLRVIIPLKKERHFIDHVYPLRRLLLGGFLLDFRFTVKITSKILYHFFASRLAPKGGTVMRKLWEGVKIIREVLIPTRSYDNNVERALRKTRGVHTIITGHSHQPRYRLVPPGKLYVNTGTWVKMMNIDLQHLGQDTGMTYALITYDGDRQPKTQLRRWFGSYEISRQVPY
ncbi:MAG: metallophosphoesterase [Pseudomonadota bacterium]